MDSSNSSRFHLIPHSTGTLTSSTASALPTSSTIRFFLRLPCLFLTIPILRDCRWQPDMEGTSLGSEEAYPVRSDMTSRIGNSVGMRHFHCLQHSARDCRCPVESQLPVHWWRRLSRSRYRLVSRWYWEVPEA